MRATPNAFVRVAFPTLLSTPTPLLALPSQPIPHPLAPQKLFVLLSTLRCFQPVASSRFAIGVFSSLARRQDGYTLAVTVLGIDKSTPSLFSTPSHPPPHPSVTLSPDAVDEFAE